MIHFFDPSNERIVAKLPDLAKKADILLGNLEDAIAVENKEAARDGPRAGRRRRSTSARRRCGRA